VRAVAASAPARSVPTLPGHPVVGSLADLRHDYLGTISRAAREVGPLARIVAGPPGWRVTLYSVASPELVAEVLSQPERYRKGAPGYRELRQSVGTNLLTSEDEVWHRQRRFLASMFTPRRVQTSYSAVMVDEAGQLVRRWRAAAREGRVLDGYAETTEVTARVIGRILFGADVAQAVPELRRFRVINAELLRRAVQPHPVPRWVPTSANRRLTRELAALRQVVTGLIAARRADPHRQDDDMLGLLLSARDADDVQDRLSDAEVVDQALVFLIAGHDTTAVTLACLFAALARAPQWQQRVQDELDRVLGGRAVTAEDVGRQRLPWTGHVVREAMRLYPAAHGTARSTRADEVLGGYRIPAGSWLEVSPWGVHHSPDVWPDPETFDPRRFDLAPGEHPGGHRYAWLPFGAGPRACIGMHLALTEVQLIVAAVLQSFTLSTELTTVSVHAAITLQPSGVLPLRVQERATAVTGPRDPSR
jgi:cytochrome P450